jgi:hypothetical protein
MTMHIEETIADLVNLVSAKEGELLQVKKTINSLRLLAGKGPAYDLSDSPPVPEKPAERNLGGKKTPRNPKSFGKREKTSKYYGVSLFKGKWRTQVWLKGKMNALGSFDDEVVAARAVDEFLVENGKPPRNFPPASL